MGQKPPERFDPAELTRELTSDAKEAIVTMFQAWALYEATLADWLIKLLGAEDDVARILVDRIDTRGKIDRLKDIYEQLGDEAIVAQLKTLGTKTASFVRVRNYVAHKVLWGTRDEGRELVYSLGKFSKGSREDMDNVVIPVSEIKKSTRFAINIAQQLVRQIFPERGPAPRAAEPSSPGVR